MASPSATVNFTSPAPPSPPSSFSSSPSSSSSSCTSNNNNAHKNNNISNSNNSQSASSIVCNSVLSSLAEAKSSHKLPFSSSSSSPCTNTTTTNNNNNINNTDLSSSSSLPKKVFETKTENGVCVKSYIDEEHQSTPTTPTISTTTRPKPPKPLWPSLLAGATQAVLFNPIDRALYLRVHNREKHLFVWANWNHPFQGFANAAIYRTISGATYLFFQDSFKYSFQTLAPQWFDTNVVIQKKDSHVNRNGTRSTNASDDNNNQHQQQQRRRNLYMLQMAVGTCAGASNGLCLNWFQLIKFRLWSEGVNSGFFTTAKHLYEVGGTRMFFRGAGVSVLRDLSFGIGYEVLRAPGLEAARRQEEEDEEARKQQLQLQENMKSGKAALVGSSSSHTTGLHPDLQMFCYNVSAGAVACIISSPFNYCRNLVYGSSTYSSPLRVSSMMVFLARECMAHKQPLSHLNARLNLGWGTVRVGVGIACGQYVYNFTNKLLG